MNQTEEDVPLLTRNHCVSRRRIDNRLFEPVTKQARLRQTHVRSAAVRAAM
jgi:hypothetical protein